MCVCSSRERGKIRESRGSCLFAECGCMCAGSWMREREYPFADVFRMYTVRPEDCLRGLEQEGGRELICLFSRGP